MKNLIFLPICILLLSGCDDVIGNGVDVVSTGQTNSAGSEIYALSTQVSRLENMEKKSDGSKPLSCRHFRSQTSLSEYSIYGLKLSSTATKNFTLTRGDRFRVTNLPAKVAARIAPDSSFEFVDAYLKRTLNRFNEPLEAIITNDRLIINLKRAPKVGEPEDRAGSIVYEKFSTQGFKELNEALTFYCR